MLFCSCDLLVAWMLQRLLRLQGCSQRSTLLALAAWLCNPFTFTISTRGSCDVLVAAMLLGCLLLLTGKGRLRQAAAAALYGLAVHFRVYPIIYAPAFVLFCTRATLAELEVCLPPGHVGRIGALVPRGYRCLDAAWLHGWGGVGRRAAGRGAWGACSPPNHWRHRQQ